MIYKYEINLFWSDEDDAYIAEVPDLPGCNAHGQTYEEALREVGVVMEAWAEIAAEEGWELPKPKARALVA